jgi:hypothetical protein
MGAGNAGSNSGGGSPNQMAKDKAKKDRIENAKSRDKFGYTKPKSKFKTFLEGGGIIGAVTKPFRDATEEVNRKFYNEKVVPAGKSKAANYESYMKDRLAGKTDAYGNPTPNQGGGNDNNNTPAPTILKKTAGGQTVQTTAPTEAELSQSAAADAEAYDLRKTKKRGRSMTTLTSSKGLTDNKLTLGKPSLLGA